MGATASKNESLTLLADLWKAGLSETDCSFCLTNDAAKLFSIDSTVTETNCVEKMKMQ